MKRIKNREDKRYRKGLVRFSLIVALLLRSSLSAPTVERGWSLSAKSRKAPLNMAYLSEIVISGGRLMNQNKASKSPPAPKDGSFAALYQFRQLEPENSSDMQSFPKV